MFKSRNHRYIKLNLIILSEFVAMLLTSIVSKYVFPIHHTMLSYLLCGAVLAALVVTAYDWLLARKRHKAKQELKELTNVVFRIYDSHNK